MCQSRPECVCQTNHIADVTLTRRDTDFHGSWSLIEGQHASRECGAPQPRTGDSHTIQVARCGRAHPPTSLKGQQGDKGQAPHKREGASN